MSVKLTYEQIYKALFSEEIEEYVPDGTSISHPIVDLRDGRIVDCFLLFSVSWDQSKYTAPTARIVIDTERKKLVDFQTTKEQPFSAYNGTDYFANDANDGAMEQEKEYQRLYMEIREMAFKEKLTAAEKENIIQYMKALKQVEYAHLLPFLIELGNPFFLWVKKVLS